jgi:predicted nuclease of predicted toxin-antitoxin system
MAMRFKLDENLPIDAAKILNDQGHDASTVFDEKMTGAADTAVASICQTETRILITLDLDFADIRTYPPRNYPGLIVLRLQRTDARYVIDFFPRLLHLLNSEPMQHRLWILDEKRLRIRS